MEALSFVFFLTFFFRFLFPRATWHTNTIIFVGFWVSEQNRLKLPSLASSVMVAVMVALYLMKNVTGT